MLNWKYKLRLGRIKKSNEAVLGGLGDSSSSSSSSRVFRGRPRHRVSPQERYRARTRQQVLMEKHRELQRSPHQQRLQLFQQRPQVNVLPPRKIRGRVMKSVPPQMQLPNGKRKSHSLNARWVRDWQEFQIHNSWSPLRPHSAPRPSCHMLEARLRAQRYFLWQHHRHQSPTSPNRAFVHPQHQPPKHQPPPRTGPVPDPLKTSGVYHAPPRPRNGGSVFVIGGQTIAMGDQGNPRASSWPGDVGHSPTRPTMHFSGKHPSIKTPGSRPENTCAD